MRPSSLALKWLLSCLIQWNRNCRTCWQGRYFNTCWLCSHKITMSNGRIRETKGMMHHTCHTGGGEKNTSRSPNIAQTYELSLGLTAVLPGLSNSSPWKPWGPRWEERGLLKNLKYHCLPTKILEALSFSTFSQGTSFGWVPFLLTCKFLKSPISSL